MNSIAAIDTITINGSLYKKLYQLSAPASLNYATKALMGYLREDTIAKKIYYKNHNAPEFVLYDFSLNVNDSLILNFPNYSSNNGYYRLDSIKTKTELGGPRRHFYFRKHVNNFNPNQDYFDVIEGIGNSYHLLYIFTYWTGTGPFNSSSACYHPWQYGLACKHNDNAKEFQSCTHTYFNQQWNYPNVFGDPCNYFYTTGGLKNNDLEQLVKIGPSPADDLLHIQIESSFQQKELIISDLSGKEIFNSNSPSVYISSNLINIKTSGLANGVYLLQLKLNDKKISRPILIQH
ncbi:MAG: T9SS type A sorting domain-containing protein [Sphingobacteriaceae bacterium]